MQLRLPLASDPAVDAWRALAQVASRRPRVRVRSADGRSVPAEVQSAVRAVVAVCRLAERHARA